MLYSKKRDDSNNARIGFAVAKKLGSAVLRNRIKRQLRHAIKPYIEYIDKSYDIILIARNKSIGMPIREMEKNIIVLLKRAHLLDLNRDE